MSQFNSQHPNLFRCFITAFFFISPLIHVITYVTITTTAPLCSNYVIILFLILLSSLIFISFNFWIRSVTTSCADDVIIAMCRAIIEVVMMVVGLLIAYLYRPNSFCSAASSGVFELIISMIMTSLFVVVISRRLAVSDDNNYDVISRIRVLVEGVVMVLERGVSRAERNKYEDREASRRSLARKLHSTSC